MFNGYRIYGFHFEPPYPKHLVFESRLIEKVVFIKLWKTESPIPNPCRPTAFCRYVGGVSPFSWLSDL